MTLLTTCERKVFDAIRGFNERGLRPSYREVASACGYKSSGHMHQVVMNLEDAGYVSTGVNAERRAICVTPAGWSA